MKFPQPSPRTLLKSLFCAAALPLALSAVPPARAQNPGDQDATFATGPVANGGVVTLALQPDGQVLAGGSFTTFRGQAANGVARLNSDGSLDTFDPGLALSGYNGGGPSVLTLALQPNGQIIVGGQFDVLNQTAGVGLARLNADGSLDSSFNAGIGVYDNGGSVGQAEALAVLANGQILVGGAFVNFNGVAAPGLVRLNADGSLDTSFNVGGAGVATNGYGGDVRSIVVQANGQIVIGGAFASYNGVAEGGVARLNADGTLDTSFQVGTGADEVVNAVAVQANGQVLAAGGFNDFDGVDIPAHLVRLNTDGSLDTSYAVDTSSIFVGGIEAILLQPDGNLLIGGDLLSSGGLINTPASGVARVLADGSFDASFDGTNSVEQADALALQPDGRLLVATDPDGLVGAAMGDVERVYAYSATPTVTIAAGVGKTLEDGSSGPGTFVVSISQAPSVKTVVKYAIKGAAISGFDYVPLSGKVKIKPGHTSATIQVVPYENDINDGSVVAVKVVVQAGNGYVVGAPANAKVKIIDNE